MTDETFEQYFGLLRHYYPDSLELYLMLDSYSAHRTEGVKERARALNVSLFLYPASDDGYFSNPLIKRFSGS
jgi:hypothetical protein